MYYLLNEAGFLCAFSPDTAFDGGGEFTGVIPENFETEPLSAWKVENNCLVLDQKRKEVIMAERRGLGEMDELLSWFDEYDRQMMQYLRCKRMGEVFDRDIEILDMQAAEKQKRIREIREIRERGGINAFNRTDAEKSEVL